MRDQDQKRCDDIQRKDNAKTIFFGLCNRLDSSELKNFHCLICQRPTSKLVASSNFVFGTTSWQLKQHAYLIRRFLSEWENFFGAFKSLCILNLVILGVKNTMNNL